jgi:murein DD-endopeptidase MepM/ murein hydrolase activator NlpD
MKRTSDPLHHLADALSDDIVAASRSALIAEAAENHADAAVFDRVASRAGREAFRRRIVLRMRSLAPALVPRATWRSAMAAAAGIAVVIVAGDILLHGPSGERSAEVAQAPAATPRRDPPPGAEAADRQMSFDLEGRAGASAAPADQPLPAAVAPSPPVSGMQEPKMLGKLLDRAEPAVRGPAPVTPPSAPAIAGSRRDAEPSNVEQDVAAARKVTSRPAAPAPDARRLAAAPPQPTESAVAPSFAWPLRGHLISAFGAPAGDRANNGIDIAAPPGSEISAADDGVVVRAGDDRKDNGSIVLVRHRNGFVTAYAPAGTLLVKAGDPVRRGKVIAKTGVSRDSGEPSLHFEIRKDEAPVDPARFLPPG